MKDNATKRGVVIDSRMSAECRNTLEKYGYNVIPLPPSPFLAAPVASHPDMLVFIGKGRLICEARYREVNREVIERIASLGKLRVITADEMLDDRYPYDVLFNSAIVGDRLICRTASTSKRILELYSPENISDVRQGYTKCSCLTVGDNGVITADRSIARKAKKAGIDTLLLSEQGVRLDGYDCGFIGGASGDDGRHIFFCGNIDRHPEGKMIRKFCLRHGREPISLSEDDLYDYGSLLFI